MTHVLLTGGTGLAGQRFLDLYGKDFEVTCLSRRPPGGRCAWIEADLSRTIDTDLLPAQIDAVIHLAQSNRYRDFPDGASDVFNVNVAAVQQLLEWSRAAQVRRFILASTGSVYGNGANPFSEDDPVSTQLSMTHYAATKLASEAIARSYSSLFDVIALRPFYIYGPGQNDSMLIPRLIKSVREQTAIFLDGHNGMSINPVFVDDAARAIARSLELRGSHTINIGGPDRVSLREACNTIGRVLGQEPVFVAREHSTASGCSADITRMRELLLPPRISFAEGIERVVQGTMLERPA